MKLQGKAHQMYIETKLLLNFVDCVISQPYELLAEHAIKVIHKYRTFSCVKKGYFLCQDFSMNLKLMQKNTFDSNSNDYVSLTILKFRQVLISLNHMLKETKNKANAHISRIDDTFLTNLKERVSKLVGIASDLICMLSSYAHNLFKQMTSSIASHVNMGENKYKSEYQALLLKFNQYKQEATKKSVSTLSQEMTKECSLPKDELAFVKEFLDSANEFCQKNPNLVITFGMRHAHSQFSAHRVGTDIKGQSKADVEFVIESAVSIMSHDQKYQEEQEAKKLADARSAVQKIMTEQGLTKEQLAQVMSQL